MKFTADAYGTISGLRFYKAATNTGVHVGSLWAADGTRLAQATFSGETASGWQTVTFASPVEIQPDTTYVVSYFAPNGHYAASAEYFYRTPAPGPNGGGIADSPPLHALRNSGSTRNGVYMYSATSTFPANSYGAGNYWVDPIFNRYAARPAPSPVCPRSRRASPRPRSSWTAPASGGSPTSYRITPYIGAVAQTAKTDRRITTPRAPRR